METDVMFQDILQQIRWTATEYVLSDFEDLEKLKSVKSVTKKILKSKSKSLYMK